MNCKHTRRPGQGRIGSAKVFNMEVNTTDNEIHPLSSNPWHAVKVSAVFKLGGRVGRTATTDPRYATFQLQLQYSPSPTRAWLLACFVMLANLQIPWTGLGPKSCGCTGGSLRERPKFQLTTKCG